MDKYAVHLTGFSMQENGAAIAAGVIKRMAARV